MPKIVNLDIKKNTACSFYVALESQADTVVFQGTPTLAAGDFRHTGDGSALAPLGTLPAAEPAGSKNVKITLSQAETNYTNIAIICSDAAGAEWRDLIIHIRTFAVNIEDLVRSTTPANTLDVSATGEAGLDFANIKDATGAHTLTNITVPTVSTLTGHTPQTGDNYARLGAPSGASVSADVLAIKTKTDNFAFTAAGHVDANVLKVGGTTQTARDIGASVLLSAGTGTGQLDFTSGVVKANLVQILATALTETAGYLAAGFKKLLNVATPLFTLDSINQTGDSFARVGAPVGASISADLAAVKSDTNTIVGQSGTTGVKVLLSQAIPEGQTARTVGGALESNEATERNLVTDSGVGGSRVVYRSDGSTPLIARTRPDAETLQP